MNLFDQNFSAKTLKAFSKNPEWVVLFANEALDALNTHELSFVVERVFEVCNHTSSVDAVHALFDVMPNINHVVIAGQLVNAWEEHMRADPNLRMPMYNYDGPGSKTTLGHLYPQRWLALTGAVTAAFAFKLKERMASCKNIDVAQAWMDRMQMLDYVRHNLETVRYNGPYNTF